MLKKFFKELKEKGFFRCSIYFINTLFYLIIRIFANLFFKLLRVRKNIILFNSKPDYSDNAKALYCHMVDNNPKGKYKYVWLVNNDIKYSNNPDTIFINKNSKHHKGITLKAIYYISISKEIYFTHRSPLKNQKAKKQQIVINLWHGCGYKAKEENKKTYLDDNYFDYVLVPGKIFIKNKSKFFGCSENKILDIGYPRYDTLLKKDKKTETFVNKLKKNNKLIVWMPTFRKTLGNEYPEEKIKRNYDLPIISSNNDLIELDKICKKNNIVLYIKRHPFQIEYTGEKETLLNIHFIEQNFFENNNIDLYSFLHYTDGLITDYSSIAIDYLLLDKPIAYTLDDFESYNNSRGFTFENPKEYMPGHHLYNFEDLKKYLYDITQDKDIYIESRKNITKEVHNKCPDYCERIIKKIQNLK